MTYDPYLDARIQDLEKRLDKARHDIAGLTALIAKIAEIDENFNVMFAGLSRRVDELESRDDRP